MAKRVESLKAPLLVAWQMTRDCDLACLHCCTESAPGKALSDELDAVQAMAVARKIARSQVPYVMLCGGEPLIVPHFFAVADFLGEAGVQLKIESNGQQLDDAVARKLARLPIRSVQISLDADSQAVFARQRPGGLLEKAHAACRAVRAAGLPLEITFAPTRLNIHEAEAVIDRAIELGAYRFNTGKLMRIGTAARRWHKLEPTEAQYRQFRRMLDSKVKRIGATMRLCYAPFSMEEGLQGFLEEAPATMLVLPNGAVKVAAALPFVCANLHRQSMADAWRAYCDAWRLETVLAAVRRASTDSSRHAQANAWQSLPIYDG